MRVLFFGPAKELANHQSEWKSIEDLSGIRICDLMQKLYAEIPELLQLKSTFMVAVNWEYQDPQSEMTLKDNDEIAIIPPVR
jgi:molybdopterin converting factor small subunit